jgi:hypothetical protein
MSVIEISDELSETVGVEPPEPPAYVASVGPPETPTPPPFEVNVKV